MNARALLRQAFDTLPHSDAASAALKTTILHTLLHFGCGLRLRSTSLQALACSRVCSSGRGRGVCPQTRSFTGGGFSCRGGVHASTHVSALLCAVFGGGMGAGRSQRGASFHGGAHLSEESGALRGLSSLLSPCPWALSLHLLTVLATTLVWQGESGVQDGIVCLLRSGMCLWQACWVDRWGGYRLRSNWVCPPNNTLWLLC